MAIGRFVIALGAALLLFFLVASLYAFHNSADGQPIIGKHVDLASPNGSWIATLEEVDNGLGFGQGMLYDEIHIRRPGEKISDHGDEDRSAVFYANSMGAQSEVRPQIKWIDSTHILISFSPSRIEGGIPGKMLKEYGGIQISYTPSR
jgi:hypothetical protein